MKILFLTVKKDAPSAKWRVLQFIPHFRQAGVDCDVEEWPGGMIARISMARRAAAYDIVFLQKRLPPKLLANRLRKYARSLVFEFDDVVTLKKTDEGLVRESSTRERRFRRIVRCADAVVTTNDHLGELARRASDDPGKVHVLPSVIDLSRWPSRTPPGPKERVTVGWMGTPPNLPSVGILHAPLVRLCRRYEQLEVKVVCEEPLALEDVRLVNQPYTPGREAEDVGTFDIAVAPLVEDPWTRGKVSTKVLAYFAAGLPVGASNVGANRLYLRDGENGFLAGTLGEWEDRLSRLLEDPALRLEVGRRARESAERDFSIASAVPRYLALFEGLASRSG